MSSGLAIHEREREEERRRRAKLARQPSNSADAPLFDEPRRVPPSAGDVLQQKIQATLGKYESIAPTVFQNQNHLLGIPRLPQTPVEGDQKFIFDAKSKDSKNLSDLKKAKAAAMISNYATWKKTLNIKDENSLKTQRVNGLLNTSGDAGVKSPLITKVQETVAPTKSSLLHSKSPPPPDEAKVDQKKAETKPVVNGVLKSRQGDEKVKETHKVKVKEEKEGRARCKSTSENENGEVVKAAMLKSSTPNKSKPPKIQLPERTTITASSEQEKCPVNENTEVERIIAEMQQVAPPLTGIHTPNKGGSSVFAFGHRNVVQENVPFPSLLPKKSTEVKKEKGGSEEVLEDLMLTDESDDEHDHHSVSPSKTTKNIRHRSHSTSSSGSSSEDSDSDSSDSDSDSSASDSNNNTKEKSSKSPIKSPSSSLKPPSERNWGLTHFVKALNQSSTPPTTKTKPSPSAANTVGEDGIRGNQIAPAANANKSSLNSHVSDQNGAVKEIKSPVPAVLEESLAPFAAELLSGSPVMDQGLDIESLTAKLDLPLEAKTNTSKTGTNSQTNKNGLAVKGNKKETAKASTLESKGKPSREKNLSEKSPLPKKPAKISKKDPKTPKPSVSAKVSDVMADATVNKTSKVSKMSNGLPKVKPKKKLDLKGSSVVIEKEQVKPVGEGDDEDVIVDIVGENSPAKLESKPLPISKVKETEKEKPKVTKSKPLLNNGLSKPVNGLLSPSRAKDIIGKNVEITYDEGNKPESLIVKIDLSLLKRIPRLPGNDLVKQEHTTLTPVSETNGLREAICSPEVKTPKRKLSDVKSVELEMPKKVKSESDLDSYLPKPRERTSSNSSMNSRHSKGSHRKRSPSLEKDSNLSKRKRHDSENNKAEDDSVDGCSNVRLVENGVQVDGLVNGVNPCQCLCSGQSDQDKREGGKREADIARFYNSEPKVPYGPDHYLAEAKKLKHKADSSSDKEEKAFFYIEAVLHFARCGKAIEQNDEESRSAFQMYSETLDLLRYTMRNFVNRYTNRSHNVPDKRLSALCMRIQSVLYMRLYKLKKDNLMRNVKMVTEHFRGPPKSTQAPSPYTSNAKITGTPSPLSPTPSPSGSVGSVGSNGSNETTPSRNGKPSSATSAMTSPVNVCIPQKIHAMTQQHVLQTNNLLYSQDTWEQAQPVVLEFRDFFVDLDRTCGPLTLHSSVVHMIEYIEEGVKRIRDTLRARSS